MQCYVQRYNVDINYYINTADDEPEYQPFIDYINDIFLQEEGDITEDDIKGKDAEDILESFGLRLKQYSKSKRFRRTNE
ncbi:hypothetical protein ACV566_16050 [Staphylococcus aureus]